MVAANHGEKSVECESPETLGACVTNWNGDSESRVSDGRGQLSGWVQARVMWLQPRVRERESGVGQTELMSVKITLLWHVTMGSWGSRLWPAPYDHYQTNVLSSHHKYICEVVQFLHNVCHKNIDKRGTPLWAWGVALCLTIAEKWQAARSPHTSDSETWWAPDPGADMSPALVTGWLVIEWQKRDLFSDFKIIQICLMLESCWVMFDAKVSNHDCFTSEES